MTTKLINPDFEPGGQVLINPNLVGAILPRKGNGSIFRVIGRTEDILVMVARTDVRDALGAAG